MKGIFVVMDGVADLPTRALDEKTPLEAAKTPNLDKLAQKGKIDYSYTVKEKVAPQSHNAMISLFGYDPNFVPRGPLEAIGAGIKLEKGDLAFRANFATIEDLESGEILDRRAGRTLTTKEAKTLAKAINQKVKLKFPFEFHATAQHRGVLVFRGGFSENITNVDPGYGKGVAHINPSNTVKYSHPMDDEEDSQVAADVVNQFFRRSYEVLNNHPVNQARAKKGLFAANCILCREPGNSPPELKKLKGKWMGLGYMPLEIGIAKATGMDVYQFKYPRMRKLDVYQNLYSGLHLAIKNAVRMIWWNRKKYDYFYVHFKETDIPGHDNKPHEKVRMIEMIDKGFFSYLNKILKDEKLIVTADHTTACKLKSHTDDPVPVLTYPNPSKKKPNSEQRFTETWAKEGRKIPGRKLLETNLF